MPVYSPSSLTVKIGEIVENELRSRSDTFPSSSDSSIMQRPIGGDFMNNSNTIVSDDATMLIRGRAFTSPSVPTAIGFSTSRSVSLHIPVPPSDDSGANRNIAWSSAVDWSRSSLDLSSDEESLPNSVSSTELSQMLSEDDFSEPDFEQEFRRQSQWEMVAHDPRIAPPFRRRAHTFDGSFRPLRRNRHQRNTRVDERHVHTESGNATQSPDDVISIAPVSSRSSKRASSSRGLLFLFMIATYTTFWLPYPDFSSDIEKVLEQKRELEDSLREAQGADTSLSSATAIADDAVDVALSEKPRIPSLGSHRSALRIVASFGRRQNMKKFRREEVADFYKQKAIAQHRQGFFPWRINVGILVSVAIWAAVDYTRKRRLQPEDDSV